MIAAFLGNIFQGVVIYLIVAVIGIGVGVVAHVSGRVAGFMAAALVGAVSLVVLYAFNDVGSFADARAQAEIASLRAAVAAKAQKAKELVATNAELTRFLEEGREAAAANANTMAALRQEIERRPIPEECAWPKEFMNDVDKLR